MVADLSTPTMTHTSTHPMMGWRYSLTRCLGRTALADIYWARDLEIKAANATNAHVLLLKVTPALSQLSGFEDALHTTLMPFTEEASCTMPMITDSGNDNGILWLVTPHTQGILFHEYFHTTHPKERTQRLRDLQLHLETIYKALQQLNPPHYGFLEPAALQFHAQGVRLLNAPLVYALRHYIQQAKAKIDYRLTLNSGYISPAVAVGDTTQAVDDVFSLACMSYHFLAGKAPFSQQNTLEAVVRHIQPTPIKGLPQHTQNTLQQGLTLQAPLRLNQPRTFIKQMNSSPSFKFILPTSVAAALVVTGIAGQHLLTQAGSYLNTTDKPTRISASSDTTMPSATESGTVLPNSALIQPLPPSIVNLSSAGVGAQFTSQTATPTSATSTLIMQIEQQVALGNKADWLAIINVLRTARNQGSTPSELSPLLSTIVNHEHHLTQQAITRKEFNTATLLLDRSATWIKEFSLANSALKQLELETSLKQQQTHQLEIEHLLAQAQEALAQGYWTTANQPTQNAALLLKKVLTYQPQHLEARQLMNEVVRKQQSTIQKQIDDKNILTTQTLLGDTAELIRVYEMTQYQSTQSTLEQRYQTLSSTQPELLIAKTTVVDTPISAGSVLSANSSAASANKVVANPINQKPKSSALSAQDLAQAIEQAATRSAITHRLKPTPASAPEPSTQKTPKEPQRSVKTPSTTASVKETSQKRVSTSLSRPASSPITVELVKLPNNKTAPTPIRITNPNIYDEPSYETMPVPDFERQPRQQQSMRRAAAAVEYSPREALSTQNELVEIPLSSILEE